jgi:hypothetical protein
MSDAIKKRMEELKEKEKLTDFQHTHLLCLNTIMDSLVSIAESLKNGGINYKYCKQYKHYKYIAGGINEKNSNIKF